ncbi:MAG TPA: phasin family protein [Alphaproteobacteria bacterium]|nr:phasin family protein [Alphaproteobacteria bacterium]
MAANTRTPNPAKSRAEGAAAEAAAAATAGAESARALFDRLSAFNALGVPPAAATERAQRSMDAALRCSTVVADGFQAVMHEMVSFTQGAMQRNLDGLQTLARCRTVEDLMATQGELLRQRLEAMIDSGAKISELTTRTATDAVQEIIQVQDEAKKA